MNDFQITKREILASISIIAIMLLLGFFISNLISNALLDKYQEYDTAVQIDNDSELFKYGMNTNIGNAFVYGNLNVLDPVSYPEIKGKYGSITKRKEKYTRHTRTVTHTRTNSKGKTETYTTTEVYYSWDSAGSESIHCNKISFLDVEFKYGKIPLDGESYLDTIYESSNVRYIYYGSPVNCKGTLYAVLGDKTISKVQFYHNSNIEDTMKLLESKWQLIIFWIFWIILIGAAVFGFYYIDNNWLESNT